MTKFDEQTGLVSINFDKNSQLGSQFDEAEHDEVSMTEVWKLFSFFVRNILIPQIFEIQLHAKISIEIVILM